MVNMQDNMYTDGRYLQHNPGWGREDAPFKTSFINRLLFRNDVHPKEIIEIGTGSGGILEILANNTGVEVLKGYDISPQAIEMARSIQSDRILFFQEDILLRQDYHTDLLLVIDVFEHVEDFYSMLAKIKNRSSYFVFHIPLDLCCRTILKPHVLQQQRETVGHIHYFTRDMVEWMLKDAGYTIIDWEYTGSETDRGLVKSSKAKLKKILRKTSFAINKNLSAKLWGGYSMMILAK
jgi:cyclopropane fatty-acyl-phospholipid synthase-like methyltransferase